MGTQTVRALDHVDFHLQKGEFAAVIGRSGSGKSTLMNILGCLDLPTNGEYILDGEHTGKMGGARLSHLRNRKIGFVFQSFHLLPDMTALENVALPLMYAGKRRKERLETAKNALQEVGLSDRVHHYPHQLSGGQQQRVAIARAAAMAPPLLLADEPTGNLDERSGVTVMQFLKTLHRGGTTILLITHDAAVAKQADRVWEMREGRLTHS